MSSNDEFTIEVEGLTKIYHVYENPQDRLWQTLCRGKKQFFHEFQALKPVSLQIKKGEALGIVGRNGSGKSTLLQLICGTVTPTAGQVRVKGRISALLELGAGFNPDFTGKENVYLNAAILGLSKEETDAKYDSILTFSGIGDKVNQPVKTYSSGMYVRLAFAVAVAIDPDILIVDEALAVGDVVFQRKCYGRIKEMQEQGTTILFVSHAENIVMETCDQSILLDEGELLIQDCPKAVFEKYNRLVFAPETSRESIKQQIRDEAQQKNLEEQGLSKGNEAFDPHMQSEICEEKIEDVEIIDPCILNKQEQPVNILTSGDAYVLSYQVKFHEAYNRARFNYRLRTTTGVLLAGANSQEYDSELKAVKAGDVYHVRFEFNNRFIEGDYFFQLGVTAMMDSERIPVCRVDDALMFRVGAERGIQNAGCVDLGSKAVVEKIVS